MSAHRRLTLTQNCLMGTSQVAPVVRNPVAKARGMRDMSSIPGSGRSPGVGNGNLLPYSCLGNTVDSGAWQLQQMCVSVCAMRGPTGRMEGRVCVCSFNKTMLLTFWLCWISVAACRVSVVAASGGCSLVALCGLLTVVLQQSPDSKCVDFSSCGLWA